MTLAEEVSKIIKIHVPQGKFSQVYNRLNSSGVISQKQKDEILWLLLQRVEALEAESLKTNVVTLPIDLSTDIQIELDKYFSSLRNDALAVLEVKEPILEEPTNSPEESWTDLQKKGREMGIYKVGMKKDELKKRIESEEQDAHQLTP